MFWYFGWCSLCNELYFCIICRSIIHDLAKKLKSQDGDMESPWFQMREKVLRIYEEVLGSSSLQLTKMVEVMTHVINLVQVSSYY
jgi:hypothetical protein